METAKEVIVEPVITTAPESVLSFFDTLLTNKNYLYVSVIVLVLAVVGWVLYTKYFKTSELKIEGVKNVEENKEADADKTKKNFLNPTNDYYIVDPDGSPILITPYIVDIIKHSMQQKQQGQQGQQQADQQAQQQAEQQKAEQQQAQQKAQQQRIQQRKQAQQKQAQQALAQKQRKEERAKSRPQLSHPGEKAQIPDDIIVSEPEDENLGSQDLNDDEIKELKKQLDSLKRNQQYNVTAQNDEDSD